MQSSKQQVVKNVGSLWAVGWLAEATWLFTFMHDSKLGHVASAALLSLAAVTFQGALWSAHRTSGLSWWGRRLVIYATSINAAWLSYAALLSFLVALRSFTSAFHVLFAVAGTICIGCYGVYVTLSTYDPVYCATMVWAFAAVWFRQHGHGHSAAVWVPALAAQGCATAAILVTMPDRGRSQHRESAGDDGSIAEGAREQLIDDAP